MKGAQVVKKSAMQELENKIKHTTVYTSSPCLESARSRGFAAVKPNGAMATFVFFLKPLLQMLVQDMLQRQPRWHCPQALVGLGGMQQVFRKGNGRAVHHIIPFKLGLQTSNYFHCLTLQCYAIGQGGKIKTN